MRAQPLVTPSWMPTLTQSGATASSSSSIPKSPIGGRALYADRWRDTHARIISARRQMESVFKLTCGINAPRLPHPGATSPYYPLPVRYWDTALPHRQFPGWRSIHPNMYLEAIDRASERIWPVLGLPHPR